MKYYKFKVRKILNNEIIIKEKNYKKAFKKLLELLGENEKIVFNNSNKDNCYEIELMDFSIEENEKNIDDFTDNLKEKLKDFNDDLQQEYTEIVCEKCGNCVLLEKDLLS